QALLRGLQAARAQTGEGRAVRRRSRSGAGHPRRVRSLSQRRKPPPRLAMMDGRGAVHTLIVGYRCGMGCGVFVLGVACGPEVGTDATSSGSDGAKVGESSTSRAAPSGGDEVTTLMPESESSSAPANADSSESSNSIGESSETGTPEEGSNCDSDGAICAE